MTYAPTTIDLSRVPAPAAIEDLDVAARQAEFRARFEAFHQAKRAADPTHPPFDVGMLDTEPVIIGGQAFAYLRNNDRARVNDAVRAVLAPLSKGTNLDNIVADANVQRLTVVPADPQTGKAAVMESDEALLRRYLLAFDRPAAGSRERYLYEAWTAWPLMGDARVNGRAVHGRLGDTDIVVMGPGGRVPTSAELATLRARVLSDEVVPEAVSTALMPAKRLEYAVQQVIVVPPGPDPEILRREAMARVTAAAASRTLIGAAVPRDLIAGAAFGSNITDVRHLLPAADIPADPYTVPVATEISIAVEVLA